MVQDDPTPALDAASLLEETHLYEVMKVDQSARAFHAALHFRPRLILLDLQGPGRTGTELALEFSADCTLGGVPIIAFESGTLEHGKIHSPTTGRRVALSRLVEAETFLAAVAGMLSPALELAPPLRLQSAL